MQDQDSIVIAYQEFASLSLDERRRRIYERMAITMPDSPITKDFIAGKIRLPEKRGRKAQKITQQQLSFVE